jgi:putative nucleotidyltransferase with HDIG domain
MKINAPTYKEALLLLKEFNSSDSLLKHAYSVEGVMRYMARKMGGEEEKWAIVGLLHDLDYEQYPDQHCQKSQEILTSKGYPEEYTRAVISHGWGICNDIKPESDMEKVLYAIDELTGFVTAVALIRPSKSVNDLETKSVMKKWRDKRFAAGVNRALIEKGAELMEVDLKSLVGDVINGMREIANRIDL